MRDEAERKAVEGNELFRIFLGFFFFFSDKLSSFAPHLWTSHTHTPHPTTTTKPVPVAPETAAAAAAAALAGVSLRLKKFKK